MTFARMLDRGSSVAVVLVDVPGFLDDVLAHELAKDPAFAVMRLDDPRLAPDETDAGRSSRWQYDAVLVVRATAASLRRATTPLPSGVHVLGTVAVTEEQEPRGDAYLVSLAGTNVSHRELADLIRNLAVR